MKSHIDAVDCWFEFVQSKVIIMLITSVASREQALNSSVMPTTGPRFSQFPLESLYAVIHTDATYAYLPSICVVYLISVPGRRDVITISLETLLGNIAPLHGLHCDADLSLFFCLVENSRFKHSFTDSLSRLQKQVKQFWDAIVLSKCLQIKSWWDTIGKTIGFETVFDFLF